MANHYVRETVAAKAISAYVILSPTGEEVATVNLHFTSSRALVNLFQNDDAASRSADFANANRLVVAAFPFRPHVNRKLKEARAPTVRAPGRGADLYTADDFRFVWSKASGYGYDKRTAALAGLVIDGIPITDHCSRYGAPKGPDLGRFPIGYKAPAGYYLANWFRVGTERLANRGTELPEGWEGYADCYRASGLDVLRAFGYRVIEVI